MVDGPADMPVMPNDLQAMLQTPKNWRARFRSNNDLPTPANQLRVEDATLELFNICFPETIENLLKIGAANGVDRLAVLQMLGVRTISANSVFITPDDLTPQEHANALKIELGNGDSNEQLVRMIRLLNSVASDMRTYRIEYLGGEQRPISAEIAVEKAASKQEIREGIMDELENILIAHHKIYPPSSFGETPPKAGNQALSIAFNRFEQAAIPVGIVPSHP